MYTTADVPQLLLNLRGNDAALKKSSIKCVK